MGALGGGEGFVWLAQGSGAWTVLAVPQPTGHTSEWPRWVSQGAGGCLGLISHVDIVASMFSRFCETEFPHLAWSTSLQRESDQQVEGGNSAPSTPC